MPYFGNKYHRGHFLVRKRSEQEGTGWLWFVQFSWVWSRLPLSMQTHESWRKKKNARVQSLVWTTRRPGQWESSFWMGSLHALCLKLGSTWPVRGCLWRSLPIGQGPCYPGLHEFNTNSVVVVYLPPNMMRPLKLLDHGVKRIIKAHYTWYCMGRMANTME